MVWMLRVLRYKTACNSPGKKTGTGARKKPRNVNQEEGVGLASGVIEDKSLGNKWSQNQKPNSQRQVRVIKIQEHCTRLLITVTIVDNNVLYA